MPPELRPLLALLLLTAAACQAVPEQDAKPHRRSPPPKPSPKPSPRPSPCPHHSPPPRQQPFRWVPLSAAQQRRAEQLLSVFENSSLRPSYDYAENLKDGRGVTFGRAGFCTGEDDGLAVVRAYVKAKLRGNPLARFLPTLERVQRQGGGDSPLLAGATQAQFIQAVKSAARDALFRQAQDRVARRLYFDPSQRLAESLGLRLALSKAQLYDAYVQHGYADPGTSEWAISVGGLAAAASQKAGASPLQGADERLWLQCFLEHRRTVLLRAGGDWAEGVQRVDIYSWLLQAGDTGLSEPLVLSYDRCRPDRRAGPCVPQRKCELRLGGITYGDFTLR
ncbi:hypothetical protein ABPG75_004991 [Micractinium tetrahymenae]